MEKERKISGVGDRRERVGMSETDTRKRTRGRNG